MEAATAPAATTAVTAGMAGAAGTATTAPKAGSQAGLFTGAPTLNIQGTPFQGAYIPNPSWQFIAPNLPPHAQMAQTALLSKREQLVLQQEEALKCERQQLEVRKLEVECKALALQSQVLLRLRPLQCKPGLDSATQHCIASVHCYCSCPSFRAGARQQLQHRRPLWRPRQVRQVRQARHPKLQAVSNKHCQQIYDNENA